MITRLEGKRILLCDGCERAEPIPHKTTPLRWLRAHRWAINPKAEGWRHFCRACVLEFGDARPPQELTE